ncbi:hypothetical protein BGX33_003614 [Mortierella sp. NVP41]|nr:hypothetical protein BGX33_003614 [Mortierella sp. NVP41]
MHKEGVQQLFTRRIGARNLTNDAFSLKCARMTFYEPPVPNVPKFVKQAMEEYEEAMAKYRQNQQELASKQDTATPTSTDTIPATTTTTTTSLSMPKPSPFIRQYSLRNLRQYPATADSLHPPFRVVYVISKKTVSKLAVHRNLCRKKLSAAVEAVFREHARPGFEFMFFAKQKCVVTPQKELEELMIKALTDPGLYADTAISHRNKDRSAHAKLFEKASYSLLPSASPPSFPPLPDSEIAKDPAIKVRWKNNQPPLKWNWWRHALPHPLGRTRQPDEYLDMHCPKPSAEETLADVVKRDSIESAKLKK